MGMFGGDDVSDSTALVPYVGGDIVSSGSDSGSSGGSSGGDGWVDYGIVSKPPSEFYTLGEVFAPLFW